MVEYQFLVNDYMATGEGRTICLLITRANPRAEDYETRGRYKDGTWISGTLKVGYTPKVIAAREFAELFGGYMLQGAENVSKEAFIEKFKHLVPEAVINMVNSDDPPGNLHFYQQFHFNFS